MIRRTSRETFAEILREGLLQKMELETFSIIVEFNDEPVTPGEIWLAYRAKHPNTRGGRNEIAKVVLRLKQQGVIEEVSRRRCRFSNRPNYTVRPTGKLPIKIEKPQATRYWVVKDIRGGWFPEHRAFEREDQALYYVEKNGGEIVEAVEKA